VLAASGHDRPPWCASAAPSARLQHQRQASRCRLPLVSRWCSTQSDEEPQHFVACNQVRGYQPGARACDRAGLSDGGIAAACGKRGACRGSPFRPQQVAAGAAAAALIRNGLGLLRLWHAAGDPDSRAEPVARAAGARTKQRCPTACAHLARTSTCPIRVSYEVTDPLLRAVMPNKLAAVLLPSHTRRAAMAIAAAQAVVARNDPRMSLLVSNSRSHNLTQSSREPYSRDHKCIVTLVPVPMLRSTMHNETMALLMR
jgi:hypothetical protein